MAPRLAVLPDRPQVLLIGDEDIALRREIEARGLEFKSGISVKSVSGEMLAGLRAVLLPFSRRLRADILAIYEDVLNAGAILIVLLPASAERAAAGAVLDSILDVECRECRFLVKKEGAVIIREAHEWARIAQDCARHDPGRGRDETVRFVSDRERPAILSVPDGVLLHRAFAGYRSIRIFGMNGGYTESQVLEVHATDSDGWECTPFVVKIGPHEEIRREIDTSREFVADRIPFPNHPTIIHDRCVVGARKRVLVSRLVEAATRFDDFIYGAKSDEDVDRALRLIFLGALRVWRAQTRLARLALVEEYQRLGVIPASDRLIRPYEVAHRSDENIRAPADLLSELHRRVGPIDVRQCLSHGDLHVRNVFARRFPPMGGQLLDVVLIDFASAGENTHEARDLATLDVSLVLDELREGDQRRRPDFDAALRLYPARVLDPDGLAGIGRREVALRALRRYALESRINEREYLVACIAYLLRYAKFVDTQGERQCATAFRLAWALAARL